MVLLQSIANIVQRDITVKANRLIHALHAMKESTRKMKALRRARIVLPVDIKLKKEWQHASLVRLENTRMRKD